MAHFVGWCVCWGYLIYNDFELFYIIIIFCDCIFGNKSCMLSHKCCVWNTNVVSENEGFSLFKVKILFNARHL